MKRKRHTDRYRVLLFRGLYLWFRTASVRVDCSRSTSAPARAGTCPISTYIPLLFVQVSFASFYGLAIFSYIYAGLFVPEIHYYYYYCFCNCSKYSNNHGSVAMPDIICTKNEGPFVDFFLCIVENNFRYGEGAYSAPSPLPPPHALEG